MKIGMDMKIKKKADEKTNIIDGKTWYLFYSAAIGSFVGQWRGRNRKSYKR